MEGLEVGTPKRIMGNFMRQMTAMAYSWKVTCPQHSFTIFDGPRDRIGLYNCT